MMPNSRLNSLKTSHKILLGVFVLLLVARIAAPVIIKNQVNKYLAEFSTSYWLHVDDVDLSLLRGAYRFEGVTGTLKQKNAHPFLSLDSVDVSVSWRDLFRGRIRSDILIFGMILDLDQQSLEAVKAKPKQSQKEAEEAGQKLFPVRISRLEIRESQATFGDLKGLPRELRLRFTNVRARASNLTPAAQTTTFVTVSGRLQDSADLEFVSEWDLNKKPFDGVASLQMIDFDLSSLNGFLKRWGPFTFERGRFDGFAELQGKEGVYHGYVKPFFKDAKMMGDQSDFKSLGHWFLEMLVGTSNLILRSPQEKIVATKLEFNYDKEFKIHWGPAVKEALKNGVGVSKVQPGFDENYKLIP